MHDGHHGEVTLPFPEPPPPGTTIEVAPGVLWARMPLPFRLNHVNVWLLDDGEGWTAVDCGIDTPETRAAWDRLAASGPLAGRRLTKLVATHGHPDHIGLAGWVAERFAAPYHATRASWLWGRVTHATAGDPTSPFVLAFLASHGAEERHRAAFAVDRGPHARLVGPQPRGFVRITEAEPVAMGGTRWQPILAEGHADEHASYWSAEAGVLIAGDQVLQRISPVVGVFASEPLADPLTDYLASLPRFSALAAGALVLPSHGLPFHGLRARVAQLAAHHDERLDKVEAALDAPRTATECARVLFDAKVLEGQWLLAMAESLAHLHRLVSEGRARKLASADGLIRFERV